MTDVDERRQLLSRNSPSGVAARLIAAAALTAALGSLAGMICERLFDPEGYAAGPPLARAAIAFAVPFPFVFAGLLVVGVPVAYTLRRLRLESGIGYALAGTAAGGLIGIALATGLPRTQILCVAYGCVSAVSLWMLLLRRA